MGFDSRTIMLLSIILASLTIAGGQDKYVAGPIMSLYDYNSHDLYVQDVYRKLEVDYEYFLRFYVRSRQGQLKKIKAFKVGYTFSYPRRLKTFGGCTNRPPCVFVSIVHGPIISYLLSFDGSQVRTLYQLFDKRVETEAEEFEDGDIMITETEHYGSQTLYGIETAAHDVVRQVKVPTMIPTIKKK